MARGRRPAVSIIWLLGLTLTPGLIGTLGLKDRDLTLLLISNVFRCW